MWYIENWQIITCFELKWYIERNIVNKREYFKTLFRNESYEKKIYILRTFQYYIYNVVVFMYIRNVREHYGYERKYTFINRKRNIFTVWQPIIG